MIGRLREKLAEKVGDLQLVLDIPARMVALEQENAELLGRVIELEQDLDDLEAITRELYVGPIDRAGPNVAPPIRGGHRAS